jgi:hypothetical protein
MNQPDQTHRIRHLERERDQVLEYARKLEQGLSSFQHGHRIASDNCMRLERKLAESDTALNDAVRTVDNLTDLLHGVANALKGPPGDLSQHSWHDLPGLAALAAHAADVAVRLNVSGAWEPNEFNDLKAKALAWARVTQEIFQPSIGDEA